MSNLECFNKPIKCLSCLLVYFKASSKLYCNNNHKIEVRTCMREGFAKLRCPDYIYDSDFELEENSNV